jgi:transposase
VQLPELSFGDVCQLFESRVTGLGQSPTRRGWQSCWQGNRGRYPQGNARGLRGRSLGTAIAEATFANDPAGHLAFIAWARSNAPEATIGIEGSSSYGAPLARSAQRAGLCVREVPPHLSRSERRRTRRPGKSDPGDALAIARVTAREANLPPIRLPDQTTELRLLVEAREDLIGEATRVRNRLHAHLIILLPGYGGTVANLVAARNRTAI